jgi:hypothetical protein
LAGFQVITYGRFWVITEASPSVIINGRFWVITEVQSSDVVLPYGRD